MQTSDTNGTIAELAAALAKAQGAFTPVTKSKTAQVRSDKGNYSYTYSTLDELIAATRPALSANGLACIQHARTDGQRVVVVTELLHTSGQRLAFPEISLPAGGTPQAVGSALTYARRYSLSASLGVAAEEDDDGRAAQDAASSKKPAAPAPAPKAAASPSPGPGPEVTAARAERAISDGQRKRMFAIAKKNNWTDEDIKALIAKHGYASSKDIRLADYDAIVQALETGEVPAEREPGDDDDAGFGAAPWEERQ